MLKRFCKEWTEKEIVQYCILFFSVFILNVIFAVQMRGPMFSDEIGHLSSVEYLVGNNWSDYVKNIGLGYYKYGATILYFPLYLLIQDRTILFISMLIFNSILLAFIPCIIYKIQKRYLNVINTKRATLIAFMIGVMPSSLVLGKMVLSETLLTFLSWIILLFLLMSLHCEKKWKQYILGVSIGFLSVWAYATHARGIVVTILVFMLVFILRLWQKISVVNLPSYLIGLFIGGFVDFIVGNFLKSHIWAGNINYNSTQEILTGWTQIDLFFSGIKTIVYTVFGWLYTMCVSSYGFAIFGLVFLVVIIFKYLKNIKEIKENELVVYIYTLLYFIGGFALGIIFMGLGTYRIIYQNEVLRLDQLIYFRYIMVPIQILAFVAIYQLTEEKQLQKYKSVCAKTVILINFIFFFFISDFLQGGTAAILQLCGLPIIPSRSHDILVDSDNIYRQLLILAVLNIVIAFVIYIGRKKVITIFIAIVSSLFLVQYFIWMFNVCLPISEYYYDKIDIAEDFCQEYDIDVETNIVLTGDRIVYPTQYKMFKYNIERQDYEELDNALIFVTNTENYEVYTLGTYYEIINNDKYSDCVLVKGEDLKDTLQEKGIELKEISQ